MYRLFFIVLFCGFSAFSLAQGDAQIATALPDGRSSAELAVTWWQWVTDTPDASDPLADEAGNFCSYGQTEAVWFLSGSYSTEKVVRHCRIPAGRHIFFPVVNMMLWDGPGGQTCSQLQADVKTAVDTVRNLEVEVDGKAIRNLQQYRYATKECFNMPDDTDHYASDGYWVLLKPLGSGQHIIHFRGKIGDGGKTAEDFVQDIEYIIEVE